MAHNSVEPRSYANERTGSLVTSDDAVATDPASGGFFASDYKKHEDLKTMLDSNKDSLKLEAMKRIIGMVARGKDASDLFPAVVKNVVSKNIEIKKLVYVYLVRYAEEQQDLALLSISTFQKGLKDPNQLIRASALRVLSSIRVPVIVPIMMLAIKEAVTDMSPFVRKTAAHAIPKLYSLDHEQKDQLVDVIEKLLADKTTLVAGSVVVAFEEVCPDRIDMIHKNFRKLCNLLIDVEEWGQMVIINMLTRYARTQFLDPNQGDMITEEGEEKFYESVASDKTEEADESDQAAARKPYVMDPDLRLLLKSSKPLLQSRNACVVVAIAQMYFHIAPKAEIGIIAKPLVRLLRSHREVQSVVLSNVATMSAKRRGLFEPFLKSFFVRSSDPTHIRLLKLEILTTLASETSISTILREFQTYVTSSDKDFVAATIHAIGRCASNIAEVTDSCLNGLMALLSNRDESVVGESVVVMKKLLQMNPTEHKEIIRHMAKLADTIAVPMARASILWLIGEYSDRVPRIAPDVLRKMARTFVEEEDIVKLQILNLGAKLCLTNAKQTRPLCQYVLNLAKYDQNYDIRDRSRFLRQLIFPAGEKGAGALSRHAKKLFLATKPAPVLESGFKDRDYFQLGSLSHIINTKADGYIELPPFPEVQPDPSVRNVELPQAWTETSALEVGKSKSKKAKKKSFYSSSEGEEEEGENNESSSEGSTATSSDDSSTSSLDSDSDSEESSSSGDESDDESSAAAGKTPHSGDSGSRVDDSSTSSVASSDQSSAEDSSDSEEAEQPKPKQRVSEAKEKRDKKGSKVSKQQPEKATTMQLLDFDDIGPPVTSGTAPPSSSILPPSLASDLQQLSLDNTTSSISVASAMFASGQSYELLNRMQTGGLTAAYRFARTTSIYSTSMAAVEITFTNQGDAPVQTIKMGQVKSQSGGVEVHAFPEVSQLCLGQSTPVSLGIDFKDTTQPASFQICTESRTFNVTIKAPVGELLQAVNMSEEDFISRQGKLTGMNENSGKVDLSSQTANDPKAIKVAVGRVANVQFVPHLDLESKVYRFAGKTLSSGSLCLVTVKATDNGTGSSLVVNCDKMVIGSMLLKDLKKSLAGPPSP